MDELNEMRLRLKALRHRFYNGEPEVAAEMNAYARQCADVYNAKAKEIAKRMGVRPRLTTWSKILHCSDFIRPNN